MCNSKHCVFYFYSWIVGSHSLWNASLIGLCRLMNSAISIPSRLVNEKSNYGFHVWFLTGLCALNYIYVQSSKTVRRLFYPQYTTMRACYLKVTHSFSLFHVKPFSLLWWLIFFCKSYDDNLLITKNVCHSSIRRWWYIFCSMEIIDLEESVVLDDTKPEGCYAHALSLSVSGYGLGHWW